MLPYTTSHAHAGKFLVECGAYGTIASASLGPGPGGVNAAAQWHSLAAIAAIANLRSFEVFQRLIQATLFQATLVLRAHLTYAPDHLPGDQPSTSASPRLLTAPVAVSFQTGSVIAQI